MPTGYTHDVQSGKITELRDFALQCARAFGALIMMRDDPMDAAIPEKFEPDDYYTKELEKARQELAAVRALSPAECEAEAKKLHGQQLKSREERYERNRIEGNRYRDMLDKVTAWEPPTGDHVGLKDFMIQQLTESLKFDCRDEENIERFYPVETLTGREWLERRSKELYESIARYASEAEKERVRAENRTAWVNTLRASLVEKQPA